MATTLLEQTRGAHEELERLERAIVKDFKNEAKTHKERLYQSHRVRIMLEQMVAQAAKLARIYQDEDGARKEDIASLKGENVYSTFTLRMEEVRDYHRRHPSNDVTEAEPEESTIKEEPHIEFSGEEALGRYLDLHEHYNHFINSKFGRRMDYLDYLSNLENFDEVKRPQRQSKAYREYLQQLLSYLESFYERTQPLGSIEKHYSKVDEEFGPRWEAGKLPGWEDQGVGKTVEGESSDVLDVGAFASVEELETLGGERLKEALTALGLKVGGTLRQRAERLMETRGKKLEEVDRKHFAKGVVPAGSRSAPEMARQRAAARDAALLEARVRKMCEVLGGALEDTKGNVEKKQARTYEEITAELEDEDPDARLDESDEEDEYIYNPLKLPLGWDGKPIPYWLYKLHGLNQEFKCEICGDASYWGRRAFERHFKEWRHQNAMRALGIPNNKNFYEVTSVQDALALWQNMQEREKGGFKPEQDEEFEDAEGNVYNRKTYEDLRRQGLI